MASVQKIEMMVFRGNGMYFLYKKDFSNKMVYSEFAMVKVILVLLATAWQSLKQLFPFVVVRPLEQECFIMMKQKKYNYKADAVRSENRESYATWESLEILVTFAPV